MTEGKKDDHPFSQVDFNIDRISSTGVRSSLLSVPTFPFRGTPRLTEMQLRAQSDPYNRNPLVFQYFPSEMEDEEETLWKDPEVMTGAFTTQFQFERIGPREVRFDLFLNDHGMSRKTAERSTRLMRTENCITWLKQHMRPQFRGPGATEPPLMELLPFPTVLPDGQVSYIFRCIVTRIRVRSTMVRSVIPDGTTDQRGRNPMRLGDRIRAVVDVTLRSHTIQPARSSGIVDSDEE